MTSGLEAKAFLLTVGAGPVSYTHLAVFVTYKKELPVVQQPIITEPEPITQEYEPKEPIVPEFEMCIRDS